MRHDACFVVRTPAKAFGDALVELREKEGMSQEGAALACGIDRKHFGEIERGNKSPTLRTVWKIVAPFKASAAELMGRTEELLAEASPASATAKRR